MHRIMTLALAAALLLPACSTKQVPERQAGSIITEKDQLLSTTNLEYSDASVVGSGASLIKSINSLDEFHRSVKSIEGVTFDDATGTLSIQQNILFDFNSYKPKKSAIKPLSEIVEAFNKLDDATLLVVGHTDNIGSTHYNQSLSERRADTIRQILVELGISEDKIEVRGEGELSPISNNDTEEGRSLNRRVEFKVIQ